jgi:mRNA interferase MazF
MKRGDLYRVSHPDRDPKKFRVFVVVSRQTVINSRFSTVICAPVYTVNDGLTSQVAIGLETGLKHESAIHCDELVSLPKSALSNYVGTLSDQNIKKLNLALTAALDLQADIEE